MMFGSVWREKIRERESKGESKGQTRNVCAIEKLQNEKEMVGGREHGREKNFWSLSENKE